MKRYHYQLFISGAVILISFIAFRQAAVIMYPAEAELANFSRFYYPIYLVVGLLGFALRPRLHPFRTDRLGLALSLTGAVVAIASGLALGFAENTETFLLYFLAAAFANGVILFAIAHFIRHLVATASADQPMQVWSFAMLAAGLTLGALTVFTYPFVPAFYLWFGLVALLVVSLFLVKRTPEKA